MVPIVIVDDSKEDLLLAERVFRECKYVNPLYLLSSGAACIDFLQKNYRVHEGQKPEPCLLFMDLAMPNLNGIQTMAAIAELIVTPAPRIVMLSAMTDVKFIRDGYQLGATTFLNKPLRVQELSEYLNSGQLFISRMIADGYELHWARR